MAGVDPDRPAHPGGTGFVTNAGLVTSHLATAAQAAGGGVWRRSTTRRCSAAASCRDVAGQIRRGAGSAALAADRMAWADAPPACWTTPPAATRPCPIPEAHTGRAGRPACGSLGGVQDPGPPGREGAQVRAFKLVVRLEADRGGGRAAGETMAGDEHRAR
ncbi:hypothetical protein QJS66_07050 [Kocuria rhizophila]|nr:hypothetical protein QJS66_07050 [Kocuria rhizophila]